MKTKQLDNVILKEISQEEFSELKVGDIVYFKMQCPVRFIKMQVTRAPFWNGDADEPGWEVETDNGFYDRESLYIDTRICPCGNDRSLEGILRKYFCGDGCADDSFLSVAYTQLISLLSDLESLGVLSDASSIISRLDEI